MGDGTKIEWTDATWNPITGCTLASEGCRNCYAARLAATRLRHHPSRAGLARLNSAGEARFTGEVRFNDAVIYQPHIWRAPRRIFVCAHGDLFAPEVPDEWVDRVFAIMACSLRHTFQVLTKRPERMRDYLLDDYRRRIAPLLNMAGAAWASSGAAFLPNVWIGASIENQQRADERLSPLREAPGALRFLSVEPLIDRVSLDLDGVGWVIVGGESGPQARPMLAEWARSIRDQCRYAGVPFFFKQWGRHVPIGQVAGALDGETLHAFPVDERK